MLPPPTAGRSLTRGTPSVSWPAFAGDRSSHTGPSGCRTRSSAQRTSHVQFLVVVYPPLLGEAEDDHSGTLVALDIDWDESFWSLLALIRNFHGIKDPAGIPSARCATSLASIFGFMSETFSGILPAFFPLPTVVS